MCNLTPEGGLTVTGTAGAMARLRDQWARLPSVRGLELPWPEPVSFEELPPGHLPFDMPEAPAVAQVLHRYGGEPGIAGLVQADVLQREIAVVVEPVHVVGLCASAYGAPVGGGRPTVTMDPAALARVATSVRRGSASGHRVAVLDTGDSSSPGMLDFLGGQAHRSPGEDKSGHGTAVAGIIRALKPTAHVESLRVVEEWNATSYQLLCALTYALWSGRYDAINVSLSTQREGGCMTVLGTSLNMVMAICQQNAKEMPVLVAAAGNSTSSQETGYPAKLAGAVIVQAWDWNRNSASYNAKVELPYQAVYASGGEKGRPFGRIQSPSGVTELYGTSFAAAVATAAVLL